MEFRIQLESELSRVVNACNVSPSFSLRFTTFRVFKRAAREFFIMYETHRKTWDCLPQVPARDLVSENQGEGAEMGQSKEHLLPFQRI